MLNAECGERLGEIRLPRVHHSSFIIHHSLSRSGVSLMEVLISIFILSIGLLGVASLIPIGKLALIETNKSDRTGACGRAGLREVKIQRMLDYRNWSPAPATPDAAGSAKIGSFAIDPLGPGSTSPLGGTNGISRCSLVGANAADIFRWKDDLVFKYSRDKTIGPQLLPGGLTYEGSYTWFATVTPATSELDIPLSQKKLFNVSVVVCYKRVPGVDGEKSSGVTFPGVTGTPPIAYTGGSVTLAAPVNVKENDWVMLCCQRGGVPFCQWYRVISAGRSSPTLPGSDLLTLLGPDWDTSLATTLVAIDSVSGVYSTVMQLDQL
jgi:hypothetical protein